MTSEGQRRAESAGIFESFDALADVVRRAGHVPPGSAAGAPEPSGIVPAAAATPGPEHGGQPQPAGGAYRPTLRRPMALLHVVDDGRETGEVVRLRGDRLLIGRSEGDVVIPHDLLMSPRHARIDRLPEGGWRLTDLASSSGTFVRVDHARLRDGRSIRVGATRLRFHEVDLTEALFVEVSPAGDGRRHDCPAPVATIGRGACTIVLADGFASDIHAIVKRRRSGWVVHNTGANGLWVQIHEPVELRATAQFLCGEQRFVFEPLG